MAFWSIFGVELVQFHPDRVSSRAPEPFGASFDNEKPVLTLFDVCVAKHRFLLEGNLCLSHKKVLSILYNIIQT